MKKIIFFMLMAAVLGLSACKKCGTVTLTSVYEARPATTGYPYTETIIRHLCNDEFEKMEGFSEVLSYTQNGVTITKTTTSVSLKD